MTVINTSADPHIGQVIAQRLQLKNLIGKGAMGSVYHVEDIVKKGNRYAIKFLSENLLAGNWLTLQRFSREASIGAQLGKKSNHIVQVMACGMYADKIPYYVMEYLEGETLKDLLKKETHLPLSKFFSISRQICLGLQVAHQGIEVDGKIYPVIHRDIKPANIIVATAPVGELVKILDFGIAKLAGDAAKLTRTSTFLGTLAYSSPEQMEGRELDNRSDIYSLGVVMFQMLTGQSPWGEAATTKSYGDWYKIHHSQQPRSFKSANYSREIPAELEELVMKCMAKAPCDRPQTVAEILKALSEIEKVQADSTRRPTSERQAKMPEPVPATPASTKQQRNDERVREEGVYFKIKGGLFNFNVIDHHAVLGVTIDDTPDTIKERYKQLARLLHPDSCKAETQAEKNLAGALFAKLVGPAYVALSKPSKRAAYLFELATTRQQLKIAASKIQFKSEVAKGLLTADGNIDHLYSESVQNIATNQYECLESVVDVIATLSELNLAYMIGKEENIGRENGKSLNENILDATTSEKISSPNEERRVKRVSPCDAYIRRATIYMTQNNFTKAIVELRDGLVLEPNNSNCHSLIGMAYLKQEQTTMARVHINKALQLNPQEPQALEGKQMLDKLTQKAGGKNPSNPPTSAGGKSPNKSSGGLFGGLFGGKK